MTIYFDKRAFEEQEKEASVHLKSLVKTNLRMSKDVNPVQASALLDASSPIGLCHRPPSWNFLGAAPGLLWLQVSGLFCSV